MNTKRWLFLHVACAAVAVGAEDFTSALGHCSVEQTPGGTVTIRDAALHIEDAVGVTVWLRQKLTAPIEITYEAATSSSATCASVCLRLL